MESLTVKSFQVVLNEFSIEVKREGGFGEGF
jgi:hypothetical protein